MENKKFKIIRFINDEKVSGTIELFNNPDVIINNNILITVDVVNDDDTFKWKLEFTGNPEIERIPPVDDLIGFTMNSKSEEYGNFYMDKDTYIDFLETIINLSFV